MNNIEIADVLKTIVGLWPRKFEAAQLEALRPELERIQCSTEQARLALQQAYREGARFFGARELLTRLRNVARPAGAEGKQGADPLALIDGLISWARRVNVREHVTVAAARDIYAEWIELAALNRERIAATNLVPSIIGDGSASFGQLQHLLVVAEIPHVMRARPHHQETEDEHDRMAQAPKERPL